MQNTTCPKCGHEATDDGACPGCGHAAAVNGTAKPPPPPEVANWVIYPTPPEVIEHLRETFDEQAFMAELRRAEQAGWPELKDLVAEIEQEAASLSGLAL